MHFTFYLSCNFISQHQQAEGQRFNSYVRPTQPTTQWVPNILPPAVKWLKHELTKLHSPSATVKNVWSYISTHPVHLHHQVLWIVLYPKVSVYWKIMHILWPGKSTALAGLQTFKKIHTWHNWIEVFFLGKASPLCYIILVSATIVQSLYTLVCRIYSLPFYLWVKVSTQWYSMGYPVKNTSPNRN